jgi:hypothetical protein
MEDDSYFLSNTVLFIQMLRHAGMPVSLEQTMDFSQALTLIDIGSREQVHHAGRSLLVSRYEHLRLFDTIFNRFWRNQSDYIGRGHTRLPSRHRRNPDHPLVVDRYLQSTMPQDAEEIEIADKRATFNNAEVLQQKEFSEMTPEELQAIKRLMQQMRWSVSLRQTRRRVRDRKGDVIHLRRVMRSAVRHNGVPLMLDWQSRKIKQRPLILIADISGSMEKYSRLILQLFYSVSHSARKVECFVFGTRLTRITPQLKFKNIDIAIDEAAREVVDWSGGTRIGGSLADFNHQWSRRVLRRGAIVLIASDGWERGDVSQLQKEMHFLQLRSYRLFWLNPLLGKSTYEPLVEGMAAAMPYIDHFLPCHNLQSLEEFGQYLGENL